MFVVGLFIHVVFLFSIFDIYFKSPIVKNVPPYHSKHQAAADRLVLFIVDGLRAESFVNHTTMTYTRSVASTHGRWGISHTRVPTESRPGHVAVIAGFYEDPSAIAKGWKENPVDFDSVFNQTRYTWCWGTYDIVDIFTKGTVDEHIIVHKLDPYDQSFSTDKNTTLLDSWVFENVKDFFMNAKHDSELQRKLHENKVAFFLHLLGTDTSGHTHKPKTEQFLTTLRFVDDGIRNIESIIRDFYNDDGKTTFLMTSDHGMTDWGSHGAGDDDETQTPYVIWGSGVKDTGWNGNIVAPEELPTENKQDVNQADLTPLMATVLSIPVPVNSIGQLPDGLLNMALADRAKAIYSNCRQLASQYDKKRNEVESNAISILYQPYEPFDRRKYNEIIEHTERLLEEEKYEKLILLSEEIMHLSLSGLTYYHNYYQRPLLVLVTLAFIGWIACLMKSLLKQSISTQTDAKLNKQSTNRNNLGINLLQFVFILLGLGSAYLVYVQNLPVQYSMYFLLPIALWWWALFSPGIWIYSFKLLDRRRQVGTFTIAILCFSLGSLSMGLSFTYRWMLSIPLLGMAIWPLCSSARSHLTSAILLFWPVTCVLLSAFTFIPVVGKQVFIELVLLAGLVWVIVGAIYVFNILWPLYKNGLESRRGIILSIFQMGLLLVTLQNVYNQSKRFEMATPVSYVDQTIAWVIAVISLVLPLTYSKRLVCRLMAINMSIITFYILLSVSHEGLFLVTLICNALCWVLIEFRLVHSSNVKIIDCMFDEEVSRSEDPQCIKIERSVSLQDFRRAFFFLLYIVVAFFGTGNIASLNSFEVRWVTCFVTSFHPFIITGLILLKTLTPFLCVACCFRAIQHLTKAPTGYLNVIVLIYSNVMGLQLLYYVKNTGSWLEIGTSISQFVIVQVITLFIVLIHQIAKALTDVNLFNVANNFMFAGRKKYV